MITKENFEQIELAYGCGYWNVCDDHACPCHPTAAVSQGFNEEVYYSMQEARFEESGKLNIELARLDRDIARFDILEEDYYCDFEGIKD